MKKNPEEIRVAVFFVRGKSPACNSHFKGGGLWLLIQEAHRDSMSARQTDTVRTIRWKSQHQPASGILLSRYAEPVVVKLFTVEECPLASFEVGEEPGHSSIINV
jgi:hypothetical protein